VHLQCNKTLFTNLRSQEDSSGEAAKKRKRIHNPDSSSDEEGQEHHMDLPQDQTSPIAGEEQNEAGVVVGTDGSSVVPAVEETAVPVAPSGEDEVPTDNQVGATSAHVDMITSSHQRVRHAY
jgi:hypothetical protein